MAYEIEPYYHFKKFRPLDGDHPEITPFVDEVNSFGGEFYDVFRSAEPLPDEVKEKIPKRLFTNKHVKKDVKELPDVFWGIFKIMCNARVKNLIEDLEPGVHEFIPFEIVNTEGRPFEGEYFGVHIGQHLDSLLVNHSHVKWYLVNNEYNQERLIETSANWKPREPFEVHSIPRIGNRHLWRSNRLFRSHAIYCSEAFWKGMKAAKVQRFQWIKVGELDLPWDEFENCGPEGLAGINQFGARSVIGEKE